MLFRSKEKGAWHFFRGNLSEFKRSRITAILPKGGVYFWQEQKKMVYILITTSRKISRTGLTGTVRMLDRQTPWR